MEDIFVSKIHVKETRGVRNLDIPLSDTERKHLIITGKNGSGKTCLLVELNKYLTGIISGQALRRQSYQNGLDNFFRQLSTLESQPKSNKIHQQIIQNKQQIKQYENLLNNLGTTQILFNNEHLLWKKAEEGSFIIAFFEAKRHINLSVPSGIKKIELQKKYPLQEKVNQQFIQYIVNLKADRSFARDDNEEKVVASIDKWFDNFQDSLRDLFGSATLQLKFDRKTYNFQIIENEKEPYGFNTLSDGYSAILSILTELLLRMEAHRVKNYDLEGLVLIDEIETHLHVDLQKKILPFLTDFFPKIQFIVSTHSPFVLSSVSNAVICDLESKIVTSDLSGYSYDALIESYFYSDKYSNSVKNKIIEFEELSLKKGLNQNEKQRLNELLKYFSSIPKYLSTELLVKLQQIELKTLTAKRS